MVADGPRMRRAICRRLRPDRQERVLHAWELAIDKTGGYLYSRALLALLSAVFHTAAFSLIGLRYPVALGVWVGLVSQFLPVIGTYLAGVLPVLVALLDDPIRALWVLIVIVIYQQIENYLFAPRITARTLELHPAVAFSAAIAGAAMLGPVGAVLALPACATVQAFLSRVGAPARRHRLRSHRPRATAPAPAAHRPPAAELTAAMAAIPFVPPLDVRYGEAEQVSPLIRRVVAENPSMFTYRGTGTYIIGQRRGRGRRSRPGARVASDALAAALEGERVTHILVTHCHADHSPLARWLARRDRRHHVRLRSSWRDRPRRTTW